MTILARAIVYAQKIRIITKSQYVSRTVGMERNTSPLINRMIHSHEFLENRIGLALYQIYNHIAKCIFIRPPISTFLFTVRICSYFMHILLDPLFCRYVTLHIFGGKS